MGVPEYFLLGTFVFLGIVSVTAAVFNIDWYFQTAGASFFVRKWGRAGARFFYAILGAALIGCGLGGLLSW